MREYIISDVSKMLGIEPHVLRYWEDELKLNITRNKLGHRYYRDHDLEVLKKIKEYKNKGFQLKSIKVFLDQGSELTQDLQPKEELTTCSENLTPVNNKLEQFQEFMKAIIVTTLKENNELLLGDIKSEVKSNFHEVINQQEMLDEKRYRKLDETIREMQKMRFEAALTTQKNKKTNPFMKKRIRP